MEVEGQSNTPQATENKDVETEKTMEVEKEDKKNDEVHYQPNKYPIEEEPYFPLHNIDNYITCSLCGKNITRTVHFQCAVCDNFFMCKECLMSRAETGSHKWTHGYHVNENLKKVVLYADTWNAEEELRLMEGMDLFRFGNWEEIAAYVGTKSERHCVDHYMKCYLSHNNLLPDPSSVLHDTFQETFNDDQVPPYTGPGSDISGYNPLRDDYDVEYDNDAEMMLKDVDILGDEDDKEKELKTCMLRAFNRRLQEREKRKKFVVERGLLDLKNILNEEKKKPKVEQDIVNLMKPFARFLSKKDYDMLMNGLIKEAKLRERIAKLQRYRKMGIRTLEEVERFEKEGAKKEDDKVVMMDVEKMDGAELLKPEEKRLCSLLHLVPRHYLSIKSTIIQECCKNGFASRDEVAKKITIDVERKDKIFDFFISCGWITTGVHINTDSK
ncbi:transcriptional adapter 2-alpha [Blastocystis sp. ATCC 50177/Nand II]|uniref:Transcriptional adapter n=1 Tax=Blastocystis sp. subtype 1 (strain ATCC 50177 / NandII) TaxID=478820 RepID=A0A196SED7_BLAHN|nr:transcriptional adapter 2-alpha [Blastocystis sp. ATCC 50177/Nand II]